MASELRHLVIFTDHHQTVLNCCQNVISDKVNTSHIRELKVQQVVDSAFITRDSVVVSVLNQFSLLVQGIPKIVKLADNVFNL